MERAFLAFIMAMKRSVTLDELEKAFRTGRVNRVLKAIGIDDVEAKKLQKLMVQGVKTAAKKAAEEA
jgi:hypothetical protein